MTRSPLAAAALASALVALAACSRPADPPAAAAAPAPAAAAPAPAAGAARPALVVTTVRPARTEIADTLVANGSIAAWQEALVGAEVGGLRIVEVRADVGPAVRRGDVIAVLQDDTVRAELASAQAAQA